MKWRTIVGWIVLVWGSSVIGLALAGVFEDDNRVPGILIGVGLVVPGLNLLWEARAMRKSDTNG